MHKQARIASFLLIFLFSSSWVLSASNLDKELLNAVSGDVKITTIEELIKAGADVNFKHPKNITPLLAALRFDRDIDIITLLINNGANVNEQILSSATTPLHLAATFTKNPNIIKLLVSKGAQLETKDNDGDTALIIAASVNPNLEITKVLLELGADIDASNKKGHDALFEALMRANNFEIIKLLIAEGFDINRMTSLRVTPLAVILKKTPDYDKVVYFLDHGANPKHKMKYNKTIIQTAAENCSDTRIIPLLIEHGADLFENTIHGSTPLHAACRFNSNKEIIIQLLDLGLDMNTKDSDGKTPLDYAKKFDNKIAIEVLSNWSANLPNPVAKESSGQIGVETLKGLSDTQQTTEHNNITALILAVNNKNIEKIKELVNRDVDINVADPKTGGTALHHAVFIDNPTEVIKLLLELGADSTIKDLSGKTPLDYAKEFNLPKVTDILNTNRISNNKNEVESILADPLTMTGRTNSNVNAGRVDNPILNVVDTLTESIPTKSPDRDELLLDLCRKKGSRELIIKMIRDGANVNATDKDGSTPLHYAVEYPADSNLISSLIALGADINARNTTGATPIIITAYDKRSGIALMTLLLSGADVNTKGGIDNGRLPLHMAIVAGYDDVVITKICEKTKNINAMTTYGHATPLLLAVGSTNANIDIVKLLLSKGADPTIKDSSGDIPLDYAKALGLTNIIKLLEGN